MASGIIDDTGRGRSGARDLAWAYVALFALVIAGGAAVTFLGNPHAGEPVVVLDVPGARVHAAAPKQAAAAPAQPPGVPLAQNLPAIAVAPPKVTQQLFAGHALIADPALIENTAAGPLPRIADDGTTPMRAYAPPAISDGHPRIAVIVGGLGISASATENAIRGLPPGVTLAFAPYAADVQHWAGEARKAGHEVLIEVPMEPYDFPDSDPGPHTLRSGVGEDSNTERLVWALTRFSGYSGVTNLLGSRFLSDANSLEPVMTFLARRGLLFYDNGTAAHSAAPDVASRVGTAFAQADSSIDKIQTAFEIDRRLSSLESLARARGSASGSGFIYPVTIDRIKSWSQGLQGRGFVLVPASAIVSQTK
jgi:polysaccharide deacetylase 2 family uncharacterized protein YibQ